MQIQFQYNYYYVALVVAVSALAAFWLYHRFSKKHDSKPLIVTFLALLRFVSLVLIGLLLLVPFVRLLKTFVEKPIVAIGLDNTISMQLADTAGINEIKQGIDKIKADFADDYEVETYVFGDEVGMSNWNLSEKKTNLNSWLKFVNNRYKHKNLGAVVMVSDGIFNEGGNPVYSGYRLPAPVYTVAVGDTTTPIDARIAYVNHNDIAYKGNQFPIVAGVAIENMKGKNMVLSLEHEGKVLERKELNPRNDNYFAEFSFLANAEAVGIKKYELHLSETEGELSFANNHQLIFVEVIDADKNILIAYDAPHPDIAAIRKSIERNRNYAVDLWWVNDPERKNEITNLDKYHLVVMHNLPRSNGAKLDRIFKSSASFMFVFDNSINAQALNQKQDYLKVHLKGSAANEVTGVYNERFVAFNLNKTTMAGFAEYPPLKALFGDVSFSNQSEVLMYQQIGNVATGYPLMAIAQEGQRKIGVLAATGIWRWFVYEYAKEENNKGLDELWNQTIQYLSVKEDKRRLRLNKNKFLFNENEDVVFGVSFYDQNYLPNNQADIEMLMTDAKGKEFRHSFLPDGGVYEMNAGEMAPGAYNYKIVAKLGDEVHQLNGTFTVAEVNIEFMQPVANHSLLYQVARQNNGQMLYPHQMNKLEEAIANSETAKPIRHEKAAISELIHNKWYFFIIVVLLSIEWVIRKYKGAY